jgi:hypothetical protein
VPQDCFGFSRCSVLTEDPPWLGWAGSGPGRTPPCQSAAEISCREPATFTLAARQVRRPHRITVIRATRAPQGQFPAAAVRMLVPARPGATPCAPSFKNGIDICSSRAAGLLRSNRRRRVDVGPAEMRAACVQRGARSPCPSSHGIWIPATTAGRYIASPAAANYRGPEMVVRSHHAWLRPCTLPDGYGC